MPPVNLQHTGSSTSEKPEKLHNAKQYNLHLQWVVIEPAGTVHQYLAQVANISRQGGTQ